MTATAFATQTQEPVIVTNGQTVNWFEIPVNHFARAVRFYEAVFETALAVEGSKESGNRMAIFKTAAGGSGCLSDATSYSLPSPHGTLIYLDASPNLEDALARVRHAGGKVVMGPITLPDGWGQCAHIIDSEGNRVGLHTAQTPQRH
jgi:predicted enzyme related to lactoylglutathione lyase